MKKPGILSGVLSNSCPHCYQGKVFKGFLKLNHNCPQCGFLFVKEEGYFIGAMIAAYFFCFFAAVPVFLLGYFVFQADVVMLIVLCSIEMIVLGPLFYRIAAIFWLWLETSLQSKLDQSDEQKRR
jgi:uncharacterized protein (DUF983 family)